MSCKISVILAAYHGERFIATQLRSLFRQRRIPDEILIGDDSDNDLTRDAVESVRGEYQGELRYVRHAERLGVNRNFSNMARSAGGDIIFFCDQDDVWLPEKIAVMTERLLSEDACQVVVCDSDLVDADLVSLHERAMDSVRDFRQKIAWLTSGHPFFPILSTGIGFYGHNMAMKRSYLPVFLQMPSSFWAYDMWLEQTGCYLGCLRYVDQPLTLYRVHSSNLSAPCTVKVKRSFWHRLEAILKSSRDISVFSSVLQDFMRFSESHVGHPENARIRGYAQFFLFRERLLRRSRCSRMVYLVCHVRGCLSYFRYGYGVRSLVRDLISPRLKAPRSEWAGGRTQ